MKPTGNPDPGSLKISYDGPMVDYATQRTRWRRFYSWTEDGQLCGSWKWTDYPPPLQEI